MAGQGEPSDVERIWAATERLRTWAIVVLVSAPSVLFGIAIGAAIGKWLL
jgi:hypothetical protein